MSRLSRLIDRRLAENFARFGLENWMYDVLATLRRGGEPYELTAGELVGQSMVTTGAITNRIDRLAAARPRRAGRRADDRRKVIVRLTPAGLALVDEVAVAHMAVEDEILADLSPPAADLAALLRTALLTLGDGHEV